VIASVKFSQHITNTALRNPTRPSTSPVIILDVTVCPAMRREVAHVLTPCINAKDKFEPDGTYHPSLTVGFAALNPPYVFNSSFRGKAAIQEPRLGQSLWTPAFAGVTVTYDHAVQ
jgi:hypothetical protein